MREIVMKVSIDTGECKVEAKGFKGSKCKEAMDFLFATLGKMKDFKRKAEWYEQNLEQNGHIDSNLCG